MDPLTNALTIIKNGYLARKHSVDIPFSRLNEEVLNRMLEAGFLESVAIESEVRKLKVALRYRDGEPAVSGVERISRPSLRVYTPASKIPKVLGGRGEVIISTPKGVLTGREAKRAKLGGELLLKVW